jgi:hypothetical protein
MLLFGILVTLLGCQARPAEAPVVPHESIGACPFERCSYGLWRAKQTLRLHRDRDVKTPVVAEVRAGQTVHAMTGVVVTTRLGEAAVLRDTDLGMRPLHVRAGQKVFVLYYEGGGLWRIWYRGVEDSAQIADVDDAAPESELSIKIRTRPTSEWWVQAKTETGTTGWTDEPQKLTSDDW